MCIRMQQNPKFLQQSGSEILVEIESAIKISGKIDHDSLNKSLKTFCPPHKYTYMHDLEAWMDVGVKVTKLCYLLCAFGLWDHIVLQALHGNTMVLCELVLFADTTNHLSVVQSLAFVL